MKVGLGMKNREIRKLWSLLVKFYGYNLIFIMLCLFILYLAEVSISITALIYAVLAYLIAIPIVGLIFYVSYVQEYEKVSDYLGDTTLMGQTFFFDELIHKYTLLKMSLFQSSQALKKADEVLVEKEQVLKRLDYDIENSVSNLEKYRDAFDKAIHIKGKIESYMCYSAMEIDINGAIVYMNDAMKSNGFEHAQSVFDIFEMRQNDFELLIRRDIDRMLFKVQTNLGIRNFYGKSIRQLVGNEVKNIFIFLEDIVTLEDVKGAHLKRSQIINLLYELSAVVSGHNSIGKVLAEALEKLNFIGFIKECGIRLYEPDKGLVLKVTNGVSHMDSFFKVKTVSRTHAGLAFINNETIVIGGENPPQIAEEEVQNYVNQGYYVVYIPLVSHDNRIGVLGIVSSKAVEKNDLFFFESIGVQLTMAIEKIMLIEEIKSNYFKTVEAFVTATEIKSSRFGGHSRRVAEVCKIIAKQLYLSEAEIDEIYMAGLLHDVGKLAFSDSEFDSYVDIHTHGKLGRQMIEKVGLNHAILDGIEHHHLDYNDASLESLGLREQPYYAQIIRVANDLDMYLTYSKVADFSKTFHLEMVLFSGERYAPNFIRILMEMFKSDSNPIFLMYHREDVDE